MSEQKLLPLKKRIEERREAVARREEREWQPITGPLGLWHFPILNAILQFLTRLRELRGYGGGRISRSLNVRAENIEKWNLIRDRSGRLKGLIVHREVKE